MWNCLESKIEAENVFSLKKLISHPHFDFDFEISWQQKRSFKFSIFACMKQVLIRVNRKPLRPLLTARYSLYSVGASRCESLFQCEWPYFNSDSRTLRYIYKAQSRTREAKVQSTVLLLSPWTVACGLWTELDDDDMNACYACDMISFYSNGFSAPVYSFRRRVYLIL